MRHGKEKKKMRLNPIVKKDVKVQSRSMKICFGVFAYELILALVFFFAMFLIQENSVYSISNIYSELVVLYPVLAITQFAILGVIVPVRTASAISGERERQTFDIMMTTGMTPFSVICGGRHVLELPVLVFCDRTSDIPFFRQHRDLMFFDL